MDSTFSRIVWALLCLTAISTGALGASRGSEVVVVFNPREHGSEEIARHYAAARGVPADQVLGLGMPTTEVVTRSRFTKDLQEPLARFLEENGLWTLSPRTQSEGSSSPRLAGVVTESKVRYLVLCRGVPLKIAGAPDLNEPGAAELRPQLRRNEAAVDSELACLPLWRAGYLAAGPLRNSVYGMTNAASLHPTNGILLVARLDGPTVEIAKGLVDKAVFVETNGFWGRAYFDLRKPTEPGMEQGERWIQSAADISRLLGFETVVEETPSTFGRGFPMSHIAVYAGWYREHVDGPFLNKEVEFMPGALAYHLHSFSAATLRVADKHWVAPLLDRGATVSLGCVHEPYLAGTPDIGTLVTRLYYMRFSFGEAAYASQPFNSWMTTVVGDPLFTPLLRPVDELHVELIERRDPLRVWSQVRLVNLNLAKGLPATQAVQYLESIPATELSAVLSEKLGDLYAGLEKPTSALKNWQAALELDPSPQQRIRLQLRLGEKLIEAEQLEEAFVVYEEFARENPRHPEVLKVYRALVTLSTQLGRETDAKRFEQEIKSRSGG